MTERELRDALRRAAPEDPAARERAWRVVTAACAQHEPVQRRPRWLALIAALALSAVAAVGAAAASAPHSGVGKLVRSVFAGDGGQRARPALGRIPDGGTLLVHAAGAWVVAGHGDRHRLGAYDGASWSPHGRFVLAWRGRELAALERDGDRRWSLAAPAPIAVARWAPVDGYRVAYVAGAELRIANGDGTGDHSYGPARAGVAPAWRPDASHVLAYVDRRGAVNVAAVDTRRTLWRSGPVARVVALAWTGDGDRLVVVTRRRLLLLGPAGQRLAGRAAPAGMTIDAALPAPRGPGIAVVRHDAAQDGSELVLLRGRRERLLFSGPGRLGAPAWSPTGRLLLVPWPDADQWLFLRAHGSGRTSTIANIAAQFTPQGARAGFPRSVDWCCAG